MAAIIALEVSGYRSLREVDLRLGPINVLVGPNGCGKSNLHRAVYLLHAAATGRLARTLADEGGMPSVLWAGARKKGPVRLSLGVSMADGLSYQLVCGLPEINDLPTSFKIDPLIKEETVAFRDRAAAVTLLDRGKSGAMLRDADGRKVNLPMTLARSESTLTQIAEPHRFPYLTVLRDRLAGWRFYQHFRTDEHAPVRQPQVGVFTPVLSHDGHDLAAALQTIREIGDAEGLYRAVRQGLEGAELIIVCPDGPDARFRVQLKTPGILRPLEAWELSDGTLRYLCLLAALLSPRPPALLALNEPEASLHPDLLTPLAALVAQAAARSQIWLTTHSTALADAVARSSGVSPIRLKKVDGETRVA